MQNHIPEHADTEESSAWYPIVCSSNFYSEIRVGHGVKRAGEESGGGFCSVHKNTRYIVSNQIKIREWPINFGTKKQV